MVGLKAPGVCQLGTQDRSIWRAVIRADPLGRPLLYERSVNVASVRIAVNQPRRHLVLGQGHGDSDVAGDGHAVGLVANGASDSRWERSEGLD
jgi:hypothetical protein